MVLMVCATFPPEPVVAATITHDLASELSKKHSVSVLTPRPSRPFGFILKKSDQNGQRKFKQIILKSYTCSRSCLLGRIRESYSFGKSVSRYINENRNEIDCVYICSWPLISQYMIVKTAKKNAIPSVVHVEDIYPESLSNKIPVFGNLVKRLLLPIDIFILKNTSKIISVSENMTLNFIQTRGISPNKISIIQNWQDKSEFDKYHQHKESMAMDQTENRLFTFMYLGNIGPVAGVDFIVRSFADADMNSARLVIAGSGSLKKECIELAAKCKKANIHFWDVPQGKVPEIQDMADVMLLPIKRGAAMSSIPSKLIAYLFSKKPVIACADETSDTALSIINANCGWIVPPEDKNNLVKKLKSVACISKEELSEYGSNGYDYAKENFSKEKNLSRLVNLINSTLYGTHTIN